MQMSIALSEAQNHNIQTRNAQIQTLQKINLELKSKSIT